MGIPRKLDTHSSASWTPIPWQPGQSERSDARGEYCLRCGGFLRQFWLEFPQGFPGDAEGMGVVDQTVEDGVGQGGIAQGVVPVSHLQGIGIRSCNHALGESSGDLDAVSLPASTECTALLTVE